jgi:peptidoglycan/xylan/chitin deacetylase (PgdA/CDA1 family)
MRLRALGSTCLLPLLAACSSSSSPTDVSPSSPPGSATDPGGTSGDGAAGSAGPFDGGGGATDGPGGPIDTGAPAGGHSDLPVPPGPSNVPKPSGNGPDLKVLPWAGFHAATTYSFDDAQPSQIDHFADLQAAMIPMTFYITVVNDWYAGYVATWKSAQAAGHELGNHTMNHCNFDLSCNGGKALATAEAEIDQCTDYIKTTLGAPDVVTMAYPFGDLGYEPDARSRFLLARGTSAGYVLPLDTSDPFNLPGVVVAANESAAALEAEIDAAYAKAAWLVFVVHSLLPDSANWYNGLDTSAVTASIAHAKTTGAWIDTVARIGTYWLGARSVAAAKATPSGGGTTWTWTLPPRYPAGRYVRVTVGGGTLTQAGRSLAWDPHGYYEVALDAGPLAWSP